MLDNKERISKVASDKLLHTYKGKHIIITSDLSAETLAWTNILNYERK
jgi:hypothetical protein